MLNAGRSSVGRSGHCVDRVVQRAFASHAGRTDTASISATATRFPTEGVPQRCPRTHPPHLTPWASRPVSTAGTICRCFGGGGDGPFGCAHHRRWYSSSSTETGKSDEGSTATTAAPTTPLSDVSQSDLDLAINAAAETEADPSNQRRQPDHLSDIPGATAGSGKKLAIVFTCTVCSTRSAKKFTERAYNHGVVLVRCPGCENLHLIADRLGFFEDRADGGWDVQKALAERGEEVVAVTDDNVLELTMADVLGGERGEVVRESTGATTGGDREGDEKEGGKDAEMGEWSDGR